MIPAVNPQVKPIDMEGKVLVREHYRVKRPKSSEKLKQQAEQIHNLLQENAQLKSTIDLYVAHLTEYEKMLTGLEQRKQEKERKRMEKTKAEQKRPEILPRLEPAAPKVKKERIHVPKAQAILIEEERTPAVREKKKRRIVTSSSDSE